VRVVVRKFEGRWCRSFPRRPRIFQGLSCWLCVARRWCGTLGFCCLVPGQRGSRGLVPLLRLWFLHGCGRILVVIHRGWNLDVRVRFAWCAVGYVWRPFAGFVLSVICVRGTVGGPLGSRTLAMTNSGSGMEYLDSLVSDSATLLPSS
jgi:hypothetical protein